MEQNVYYTALINNHDSKVNDEDLTEEPQLTFNEDRQYPIIENCQDYQMSIINFKMDTKSLPVFIPIIKYDDSNPTADVTIYNVYFSYEGYIAKDAVRFDAQDETKTKPPRKNGYANYASGYYNHYNFERFIYSLNRSVVRCLSNIINQVSASGNASAIANLNALQNPNGRWDCPFFVYDKGSQTIYLNVPKSTYDDDILNNSHITMHLNEPLYRLMDSFPYNKQNLNYINSAGEQPILKLYTLNMNNFRSGTEIQMYAKQSGGTFRTDVKTTHFIIGQDYETLTSWSPIESIVFTSSTIPINSSIISANHSYEDGRETTEGSTNTIEMELSEFRAGQPKPGVIYEPKVLRWLNMKDQAELRLINLQVYYRFKYTGELIPLRINSGGSFSAKFCFRKIQV